MRLSQEGPVCVQVCGTGSEYLSRRIKNYIGRSSLSLSAEVTLERVMNITAEMGTLLIRLND